MDATTGQGPKLWLTVKEAAEAMGVSPDAVYDLAARSKIIHYRAGGDRGRIRFRPSDVEAYLESRRLGVAPKPRVLPVPKAPAPRPRKDHFR